MGYVVAKRVIDLFLGTLALVILMPLFVVLSILIKLSSPGPAFYRHERIGQRGRAIRVWKFRSMSSDPIALTIEQQEEFADSFKIRDDPRVTRIGRFMRNTSLDEIPQLINVVVGSMSLVGPRPVVGVELEDKYGETGTLLVSVKPGITGLWQVSGRSALSYEERVRLDLEYVMRRSLWFDLRLIVLTVPAVLLRRGAV